MIDGSFLHSHQRLRVGPIDECTPLLQSFMLTVCKGKY